jgi:hypothetical protein
MNSTIYCLCNRWGVISSPICVSFLGFYRTTFFLQKIDRVSRGTSAKSFSHSFITEAACNVLQRRLSCVCVGGGGGGLITAPPLPQPQTISVVIQQRRLCIGLYLIHRKCKLPKITQPRFFSYSGIIVSEKSHFYLRFSLEHCNTLPGVKDILE